MLSGKILQANGWPAGKIIGLAKAAGERMEQLGATQTEILARLDAVRRDPGAFLVEPQFADLAREVIRRSAPLVEEAPTLRAEPAAYAIWGADQIDRDAISQMEQALRLPVAVAGALMPDAHIGYGLPIGGVLATHDAVIPYAIGVDIACRMRLSVYPVSPHVLGQRPNDFRRALMEHTRFGQREGWERSELPQHPVLDDPAWQATRLLKSLQFKASQQLGTSGSGNHFVEWGAFRLYAAEPQLGLEPGEYLALLSHSGSRGVGFKIANTFTEVAARERVGLSSEMRRLAWLALSSEAGQEYWLSMELAGRFASANHHIIHRRVAAAVGLKEVAVVENHHNFAQLETLANGENAVVHRKGATPAEKGVLGVIPGSMADAGYVVRGRGEAKALNSASHGAGRAMSRNTALRSITRSLCDQYLRERGITLLGGGVDEAPQAYKDIETVIKAQGDLAEIIGKFTPRIVRMADEPGDY